MSVEVPEYVITEEVSISSSTRDTVILPAGSFVKPVERQYVPQHVRDAHESLYTHFNGQLSTYCYTRYGFALIAKKLLRER